MHEEIRKHLTGEYTMLFDRIEYRFNENFNREVGRSKTIVRDTITIKGKTEKGVAIGYTRALSWENNPPYEITVDCSVFMDIREGTPSDLDWDKILSLLEEDLLNNPRDYFLEVYSKATSIISNITLAAVGFAVVTPPTPCINS